MRIEYPHRRQCFLLLVLLVILLPGTDAFFSSILDWIFSARTAVSGASMVVSLFRTAFRVFTLLDPTTGVINVLRGRRDLGTSFESVKETFITTAAHDRLQCLPLVLCAIYADPDDSASPLQSQFKKEFRSLFPKKYTPTWASSYVKAAHLGESSALASRCQTAYPSCPFSSGYLKRLIFKSLDAEWNKGKVNGVYT